MAVVLLPTTLWHNDMVVGVTWALTAICIILVALRFYVRVTIRQLSSDDWIMLLAVVSFSKHRTGRLGNHANILGLLTRLYK